MDVRPANDPVESVHWPYLATAAVLTTFAPATLRPLSGKENVGDVLAMITQYAEPIHFGPARGQWRLSDDVRQQVLRTLGRSSIQQALNANPDRPDNPTQRALEELARSSRKPTLKGRTLEELLGFERAVDWLDGALDNQLPTRSEILARIERQKFLEPMQRLAGSEFVGRKSELAQLRRYLDHLPSAGFLERVQRASDRILYTFVNRPPLVIHGPGGVGKSTLVAHFILEHAGPDHTRPMPFVYLDFDRWTSYFARNRQTGAVENLRTDELLAEALRQIRYQFPEVAADAAGLETVAAERADSEETSDFAVSGHYEQSSELRQRLAELLNVLGKRQNRNILLVIDTFEIVQRRGASAVFNLLEMVAFLLQEVSRLRVVIAGRGNLRAEDFDFAGRGVPKWEVLPLSGFDPLSGRAYLRARLAKLGIGSIPESIQERIVSLTRGNPLSLRLAASVFARAGINALETAIGRQELDSALANEQIQGMLHARIVEHLDDDRLKRIADPGLIVRRINPEVIALVLAGHCGLKLASPKDAVDLYDKLQNEVSLVEPTDDGQLRHRPEVRLLMIPLIRLKLGNEARYIDESAVAYWQGKTGSAARAEEIYHRMWLGQTDRELERRWDPSAAPFLQDAFDELDDLDVNPEGRVWLADRLGRELSKELRSRAEQTIWERDTDRKARQLITDGYVADALNVVRERTARSPVSPIWILEIDILRLLGRIPESLDLLDEALAVARGVNAPAHILALLLRRASIEERLSRFEKAFETASEARELSERQNEPVSVFSSCLLCARLLRKRYEEARRKPLVEKLCAALGDPAVRAALTFQSSLLREAAAELGEHEPQLLFAALERLGLQSGDWDVERLPVLTGILQKFAPQLLKSASERAPQVERVGSEIAAILKKVSPDDPELWRELSAFYAQSVDRLLQQTI
jgi:tetratricopeptide (TPR) repeat protein